MATANYTESATPRALVGHSLAQFDQEMEIDDLGLLSDRDTGRLTAALQRSAPLEVLECIGRSKGSRVEATALMCAHEALHVRGEQSAWALFDKWLDLNLRGRAQTSREIALVDYADVCLECAA